MTNAHGPGWATEAVELVDPDPAWAEAGKVECFELQTLLAPWRIGDVEHVGSTAVPGLAAKPIVDLQALVANLDVADDVAATLVNHRWHYVPTDLDNRPFRSFFVKIDDGRRAAYLHLLAAHGDRWLRQLAFRDALRAGPARRDVYARLKMELSLRHRDDREAYSACKLGFVDQVVTRRDRTTRRRVLHLVARAAASLLPSHGPLDQDQKRPGGGIGVGGAKFSCGALSPSRHPAPAVVHGIAYAVVGTLMGVGVGFFAFSGSADLSTVGSAVIVGLIYATSLRVRKG